MLTSVIILGLAGMLLVASDHLARVRLQPPQGGPGKPVVSVRPQSAPVGWSRLEFGLVRQPAPAPYFRPDLLPSGATASRP